MYQAEVAWACISRLGTSQGGLSSTVWRQVYTGSIRAIATYGWELADTDDPAGDGETLEPTIQGSEEDHWGIPWLSSGPYREYIKGGTYTGQDLGYEGTGGGKDTGEGSPRQPDTQGGGELENW